MAERPSPRRENREEASTISPIDPSAPLVSIVTPSFNQAQFLEQTILSVLSQDYPNLEYIIVDGGSTDGSLEILRHYEGELKDWVSEPDRGQADAIRKGMDRSRGEILAWINSDDLYMPGAVSEAVSAFQESPECGLVYGDGILIDQDNRILDWHRYPQFDAYDLLRFEVILQPAAFFRRQVYFGAGGLGSEYHLILDHDLWVRIALRSPLKHVEGYWAAERTYPQAKTIAAAAQFVGEAERFISRISGLAREARGLDLQSARFEAGLASFSGRRMIDAGQYQAALGYLLKAFRLHIATGLRYWYKFLQALMGWLGLEGLFLWYRHMRRNLQHKDLHLKVDEQGVRICGE